MESFRPLTLRRRNLRLHEWLQQYTRVKLPDDWCGYQTATTSEPVFQGHDRFEDEDAWVGHYRGPDYCRDLVAIQAIEEALIERDLLGPYMLSLADRAYEDWRDVYDDNEVYLFWYSLASATPIVRARAAAAALNDPDEPPVLWISFYRKSLVKHVAKLAENWDASDQQLYAATTEAVLKVLSEADASDRQLVVAVAWFGSGRFKSLRQALWAASRQLNDAESAVHALQVVDEVAKALQKVATDWMLHGRPS